jgi:hypothetical protein
MLAKILIAGGLAVLTVAMHAVGLNVLPPGRNVRRRCRTGRRQYRRRSPLPSRKPPKTARFFHSQINRPGARQREAPNVVIVLLDDVGFGVASTFGGPVKTPDMDALAKEGLRYNRFFDTALRSPTRAPLLYFPLLAGRFVICHNPDPLSSCMP